MHTPVIEFENTTDNIIWQIIAVTWKVSRIYVRFRYDYFNGGTGANYRSYRRLFEFEWPYMNDDTYEDLMAIVESIAGGDTVRINSIGDTVYSNMDVELDKDAFLETEGEFAEHRKVKIGFISKNAQSIV